MSKELRLDTTYLENEVSQSDFDNILPEVEKAHALLTQKNGPGSEYLGWMDLPENIGEAIIKDIIKTAEELNDISDVIVVIGIGGSYLGARAAVEALSENSENNKIIFTGFNLSSDQITSVLDRIKDKDFSVNVISKSGTTTEPAIVFRVVEDFLKEKYGKGNYKNRVVCTTDSEKGALKRAADEKGFKCFVIPPDIGGRFSVLTPVGLLPIALSGADIREMIEGACFQRERSLECDLGKNISYKYAASRHVLYRKGKTIEVIANFDDGLHYISEWWKQLFGESEGKSGRSIFPASCDFSEDLHSMGQLLQDGQRNIFETFLICGEGKTEVCIPNDDRDLDNLNYLSGKTCDYVNQKAYEATSEAHFEGGVPNSTIFFSGKTPFDIGQIFYFFEKAVAISAYMFGVNPFNQPGVEAYKQKMFKLLCKPE